MMEDDLLPPTLSQKEGTILSQSQDSSQGSKKPWGRLLSNRCYLKNIDLVTASFSFGRSEGCSMVLTQKMMTNHDINMFDNISKKHFEISKCPQDNLVYIKDLSKNGTYVNGSKIGKGKSRILKTGDEVFLFHPPKKFYIFQRTDGEELEKILPVELSAKYAFIKQIGRGAAGEVYMVKERETCKPYAIKKIVKSARNTSQMFRINHPTKISNEINILRSLKHPSIINMVEILEDEKIVYIVLEYMAGGDLYPRIVDTDFVLPEDVAKFYFYQMALGVSYLHSHGISHRDLKPENILLLSHDLETVLKITDFGLSKNADHDDLTTMCGTYKYVAPEVICTTFRDYGEYGKEVDVWSLGVILFFMLSKTYPFDGPDNASLKKQIVKAEYTFEDKHWQNISKEAQDLIKVMLVPYPKRRIKIDEIFRHKWIAGDHPMKYRVHNLIRAHMPIGFEIEAQEPPEKKYKFTVFSGSNSDTDSGESDATMRCYDLAMGSYDSFSV